MARCRNTWVRHWFAYWGEVGTSSPVCRRCGEPNPNYRPDDDPRREVPNHVWRELRG